VPHDEQLLANRYRLIQLVGQGTMGAVYDAEDLVFKRRVALKRLRYDPEVGAHIIEQSRAQFEREAKILATLRHPNLPRVTDYFTDGNQEFLVMDYIEGQSLDALMALQPGGFDEFTVLSWADQLLLALEYIHHHGLVHRDVKPANVRVTPEGQVFLVDFGLVKVYDPGSPKTATVIRGLGTPQYAPPEQYDAELGHTEPRSDVYALGATLYHLLTGEPPPTVTRRVSSPGSFRPLREIKPTISPELERVVLRAMEVSITKRYASAADMRSALKMTRVRPLADPADTSLLPSAELIAARRRRRTLVVASFLLVLLLLCSGALALGAPGWLAAPTFTPTSTATSIATPTATSTATRTATRIATSTSTSTATRTATRTATPTFTPSATATSTASATATPTRTATRRRTPTPTVESSLTPTSTSVPSGPGPVPRTSTPTPTSRPPTSTHTPVPPPTSTFTPTLRPTLPAE
jgi:serine/threonine-protein kinase